MNYAIDPTEATMLERAIKIARHNTAFAPEAYPALRDGEMVVPSGDPQAIAVLEHLRHLMGYDVPMEVLLTASVDQFEAELVATWTLRAILRAALLCEMAA
jgi:hypothetical protein